jgi:hypothetical protein
VQKLARRPPDQRPALRAAGRTTLAGASSDQHPAAVPATAPARDINASGEYTGGLAGTGATAASGMTSAQRAAGFG